MTVAISSTPLIMLTIPALIIYPFDPQPIHFGFIAMLGVVQIALPYVLLVMAGKHCPPLAGNLLGMLEPILNPIWVLLFYGEKPGMFALCGGVVILTSVAVWTIASARAEERETLAAGTETDAPARKE